MNDDHVPEEHRDDLAFVHKLVDHFVACLADAQERRPDLFAGFAARRYALVLASDGMTVVEGVPAVVMGLRDAEELL